MGTELSLLIARLHFDQDADARLAAALRERGYACPEPVEGMS